MTRPTASVRGRHPDTIFTGGSILTMDGESPEYVEAVAISAGLIAFVGTMDAATSRFPAAVVRDLAGAALLPGFIDAHSHLSFGFDLIDQVAVGAPPVGECTDIASVVAALERFRSERQVPAGGLIVGWGYDQDTLAEGRHITASDLDVAFPEHRVVLVHVSSHGAVLNSSALQWAGIDASTPDVAGGVIARDAGSREPSGLLMEQAFLQLVRERLPHPVPEQRHALLEPVQRLYSSQGYTHAQDGFASVADMDFFRDAAARGELALDVALLGSFLEAERWIGNPAYPVGEYRDGLTVTGMKVVYDGSPQGKTAYLTQPYGTGGPAGEPQWRGAATMPFETLAALIAQGRSAGVQVFVHVNGDAAIDDLIRAVRQSGVTADDDHRTVAIHSQFQRPDHLDDYAELGITPSYFTNHVYFWGDIHRANIGAKAEFISPLRSATARGLVVSNHSDFTVTPLNPFHLVWTAMTRTTRSGAVLGPGERVDAYAALKALTTGAAFQAFEEHRKGRLTEGLLADLVLLSENPIDAGVDRVRDIVVLETIKEGAMIYRAD